MCDINDNEQLPIYLLSKNNSITEITLKCKIQLNSIHINEKKHFSVKNVDK